MESDAVIYRQVHSGKLDNSSRLHDWNIDLTPIRRVTLASKGDDMVSKNTLSEPNLAIRAKG